VNRRKRVKFVHAGHFVAEVDVELIEDETGWAPYLSLEDAQKLDEVRSALQRGDVMAAASVSRVYELRPVVSR
jgi:hypothetical protein